MIKPVIDIDKIVHYAAILKDKKLVLRTPFCLLPNLPQTQGLRILVKDEGQQHTGSFKPRVMGPLLDAIQNKGISDIFLATTGNQGIAGAHTANLFKLKAHIIMPYDSPKSKFDYIRRLNGEIVSEYQKSPIKDFQEAVDVAQLLAKTTPGGYYIPHGGEPEILSYGSLAVEIIEMLQADNIDINKIAIAVPVGAGGLAAGVFGYIKTLFSKATTIGIQTDFCDTLCDSLIKGEAIRKPVTPYILEDGINTGGLELESFAVLSDCVDVVVAVDTGLLEEKQPEIQKAMQYYYENGIRAEGAAVLPWMAFVQLSQLTEKLLERGVNTIILISTGKNINPHLYLDIIGNKKLRESPTEFNCRSWFRE